MRLDHFRHRLFIYDFFRLLRVVDTAVPNYAYETFRLQLSHIGLQCGVIFFVAAHTESLVFCGAPRHH